VALESGAVREAAAAAVLEVLRGRGVRFVFGLPGSTEAPLLDALREAHDVRYVLALHEGVAVAMADGYARASRGPAVANLHTTVGTLAGLSLLYNCWRDRVPVVVLAAHKDTRILGRAGFTSLPDTTALVRPLCKWAHQSLRAEQVAEDLERAFQQALASPPGPAYVLVPEDLLAERVAIARPQLAPRASPPRPHARAVKEVVALLVNAERPVLLVGSELERSEAADLVVRLSEALELPVLWEPRRTVTGVAYPADGPRFVDSYEPSHPAVAEADVLLALGAVLFVEFSPPQAPEVSAHLRLVHVHPDAAELGRLYPPAVAVHADPHLLLQDVLEELAGASECVEPLRPQRRAWVARLRAWWEARPRERALPEAGVVGAFQVGEELGRVLPPNALVVEEAVRSSAAFLDGYPAKPGGLLRTSGGSLGWGAPAALGAQMACPDRLVVAVVGDGCLHFTPQALWTAVRQRLPVLVVVLNNRKYLAVEAGVRRLRGGNVGPDTPGIDLPGIDHGRVAQGYGAGALRVEAAGEQSSATSSERVSGVHGRKAGPMWWTCPSRTNRGIDEGGRMRRVSRVSVAVLCGVLLLSASAASAEIFLAIERG
jgi:benzoylformate decarboxylase